VSNHRVAAPQTPGLLLRLKERVVHKNEALAKQFDFRSLRRDSTGPGSRAYQRSSYQDGTKDVFKAMARRDKTAGPITAPAPVQVVAVAAKPTAPPVTVAVAVKPVAIAAPISAPSGKGYNVKYSEHDPRVAGTGRLWVPHLFKEVGLSILTRVSGRLA
jgi:hypothetical protein